MALIKCHECGKKVSTEAAVCPACGAAVKIPEPKKKTPTRGVYRILGYALCAYLVVIFVTVLFRRDPTPEELKQKADAQKAELAQKAEKDKADAILNNRIKAAAIAAQSIQQSARNPQSVSWEGILANDDASVICFELRAQNGFGGMNLEQIAVIKGVIKTSDAAWNNNCIHRKMFDVRPDVIRLLKIYK
jgi:DNA-directed RNA polymerase subunit RPC12/RpoP